MTKTMRGWDQVSRRLGEQVTILGVRGLARQLGLSPAFISKVSNGELPISERLADLLGFTVETVVTYRRKR